MQSTAENEFYSQHATRLYTLLIIAIGLSVASVAAVSLPVARLDLNFLILAACTIALGSRILIKMPRFNSHIAVSDTFIFLTMLLYGGEAAILLAAVETFFSARRFCNIWSTIFFNVATLSLATAATFIALTAFGLTSAYQLRAQDGYITDFFTALALIALTQFAVNTSLAAGYDAIKRSMPLSQTWKEKYVWTIFTYVIGSATAGLLAFLVHRVGFGVVLFSIPIIVLVFVAYRVYLENLEMSAAQADEAEKNAEELKVRSVALEESEQRFKSAFNYAPIGIALVAPDGRCLRANRALSTILGYTATEFLDLEFQSLIHPSDLRDALGQIRSVTRGKSPSCQMEQRFLNKSGRIVWGSWSLSAAGDPVSGTNLIFQLQDVTDKKEAEAKLHHEANHDALTGLPNRLFFTQRLTAALAKRAKEAKYHVSVLFIDLDRFKNVNDSLGHVAGDQLLVDIAGRLRDSMRPPDIVARLGGDEFVILVEGRFYNEKATLIAERVQRQFREPFTVCGREVYSSASIGILHASDNHLTSEDIMRDADTAMYQAKRGGNARHEIFDDTMHAAAKETLQLETDLRRAIENGDLDVLYQPIVQLSDQKVVGVESLARWNHPELGEISPDRFIHVAEEIGWIDALGELILRKATSEIAPIFSDPVRLSTFKLSVNLSSNQFGRIDLVPRIKQILEESNFPINCLKLEITESVIITYQERAIEMLHHLRGLGIDVDIDDFGTGYSNLSYLVRLPISTLKIDRSFVSPLHEDEANIEVVRTIISLARNLGLKVIAEGIETEAQVEVLRMLGCERGQGYYFAKPMTREDLMKFLDMDAPVPRPLGGIEDVSFISVLQ